MSPILLRPIREQVAHDRVIRQLQVLYRRRRYAVGMNVGASKETKIRVAEQELYPDLVIRSTEGGRRLQAVIEVETTESVNRIEAMAQWARFAKARGAFHLYVPVGMADLAQRLCSANGINLAEVWTFYAVGDQIRFTMAYRSDSAKRALLARKAMDVKKTKKVASSKSSKKQAKAARAKKVGKKKLTKKKPAVSRSQSAARPGRPKAGVKKRTKSKTRRVKTASSKRRVS